MDEENYPPRVNNSSSSNNMLATYGALIDLDADAVLEDSLRRVPSSTLHGNSLANWLSTQATAVERQNLTELVKMVEDFEAVRGLAPPGRRPLEADGCVTIRLGSSLRVEMRFRV